MKSQRFLAFVTALAAAALIMQAPISSRVQAQGATPAATAAAGSDQFAPTQLNKIVSDLSAATKGKASDPSQIRLAIVVNVLSPFWTAAAIGEQRASSELGAPVVFE